MQQKTKSIVHNVGHFGFDICLDDCRLGLILLEFRCHWMIITFNENGDRYADN